MSEPMELETTPPIKRFVRVVPENEYKPCKTRKEAETKLLECQVYALKNAKRLNQFQMQTVLMEILDAKDELSIFPSQSGGKRETK